MTIHQQVCGLASDREASASPSPSLDATDLWEALRDLGDISDRLYALLPASTREGEEASGTPLQAVASVFFDAVMAAGRTAESRFNVWLAAEAGAGRGKFQTSRLFPPGTLGSEWEADIAIRTAYADAKVARS